jgi:hypothetical protein
VNLTSFRGITFTTLGVTSPKWANVASPGSVRNIAALNRIGADPIITGVENGPRSMAFDVTTATGQHVESTLAKVIAACNPDDPVPGTLVGVFNKAAGTAVTVEAQATAVGPWQYPDVNTVRVTFVLSSPWREQSATTLKTAGLVSADGSFTNLNTGFRDVLPTVTVYWDGTQRASTTATFGFKNRISTTITNNGTEPLVNQPYQIGPINTNDIVLSGEMQSDGDDLRIFCEGKELRRNLIGINKEATFIWIILPTMAPGQSLILDVVYNNSNATNPPTLTATSDPPLPGMDISGDGRTATSATTTTITSSGAGWDVDRWDGGTVMTAWGTSKQMRRVNDNTATILTVTRAFPVAPTGEDFVVVKSGIMGDGGIASAGSSTSVTDSSQSWFTNEWIGATAEIISGTGNGSKGTVTSNTATALTVTSWSGTAPAASSQFRVYRLNGARMWDTRPVPKTTSHPGLWFTNKTTAPPTIINFDAPGSWYRFTYQKSNDEYSQPRYASFTVGAGDLDHMPTMYIQRARKGRVGDQREVGLADSVGVFSPFPILGVHFGYTFRNAKQAGSGSPGEGMCEARFMQQDSGGSSWAAFASDVTVYSTSTAVTPAWYDLSGSLPNRIAMALIPNGSDEIPENDNNTALLQSSGNYIRLPVNSSTLTDSRDWVNVAFPTTVDVAVYDIDLIVRNGGASATKPYDRIRIGGTDHRVFIAATDERIVVDCEKHTVTLTTDAGVYVRKIPYCVQAQEVIADPVTGIERTLVNARWLPIPSTATDTSNIFYDDDSGAGWGSIGLLVTGKLGYLT